MSRRGRNREDIYFFGLQIFTNVDESLNGPGRASADHHVRSRHHAHSVHEVLYERSRKGGRKDGRDGVREG